MHKEEIVSRHKQTLSQQSWQSSYVEFVTTRIFMLRQTFKRLTIYAMKLCRDIRKLCHDIIQDKRQKLCREIYKPCRNKDSRLCHLILRQIPRQSLRQKTKTTMSRHRITMSRQKGQFGPAQKPTSSSSIFGPASLMSL